ncbi:hypothetical protein [Asticcacaulis sp. 201]|uniref:hypothetical protein n=1 Tax=Asticcacaulis sp. 201 TaxID=3028787 RepID=UPI002916E205|nr:hypothetical protein [Asticcacaulis sp. 201]MDV6330583.1 hypothetical protein [Asticcacaulis sp. 201]
MKKTLIAIAAAAATLTAVSAPAIASAEPRAAIVVVDNRNDFRASAQLNARIDRLDDRISQGRRNGAISVREGRRLDAELRSIVSQKRGFERTGRGLNRAEIAQIDNRLDRLQGMIRYERNDRDNHRR